MQFSAWVRKHRANIEFRFFVTVGVECVFDGAVDIFNQVQENCLTIFLPKEVDHHNAEEVKKSADAIIEKEHIKYVIFDFEQTDFMDSSGIGVIMGRYRMICLIGGVE